MKRESLTPVFFAQVISELEGVMEENCDATEKQRRDWREVRGKAGKGGGVERRQRWMETQKEGIEGGKLSKWREKEREKKRQKREKKKQKEDLGYKEGIQFKGEIREKEEKNREKEEKNQWE